MKVIPDSFQKNGWNYRLVERSDRFAIYNQGGGSAFELVRIRTREASDTPHFKIEAGEYLPTTNEWGRHGWTHHTLERARSAMAEKSVGGAK
jgi:hypothetical protein